MSILSKQEEMRLIAKAVDGHREACGDLIRHYQGSLYAYLLKMSGRPDVAEDIAQEAFVRVLNNLDRFDPQYRFSTWLFTIARRLYLNAMQKQKPAYNTDAVGGMVGHNQRPEEPLTEYEEQQTDRSALQRALGGLSDEQRQILLLFHQQDWSIAVIAQHMGMPEGTVKSHLHRGRRRLRAFLGNEERYAAMHARCEAAGEVTVVRSSSARSLTRAPATAASPASHPGGGRSRSGASGSTSLIERGGA